MQQLLFFRGFFFPNKAVNLSSAFCAKGAADEDHSEEVKP